MKAPDDVNPSIILTDFDEMMILVAELGIVFNVVTRAKTSRGMTLMSIQEISTKLKEKG